MTTKGSGSRIKDHKAARDTWDRAYGKKKHKSVLECVNDVLSKSVDKAMKNFMK